MKLVASGIREMDFLQRVHFHLVYALCCDLLNGGFDDVGRQRETRPRTQANIESALLKWAALDTHRDSGIWHLALTFGKEGKFK